MRVEIATKSLEWHPAAYFKPGDVISTTVHKDVALVTKNFLVFLGAGLCISLQDCRDQYRLVNAKIVVEA